MFNTEGRVEMMGPRLSAPQKAEPAPPFVSGGVLQRKCACGNHSMGGDCGECSKKEGLLQRRSGGGFESPEVPRIVNEVVNSPGQPLNSEARAFMEPRFAHDFSSVRVHTDARAAESALAVNALAYTIGRDVVFGAGQYAPATSEGRKLLAHELTHVEQQRNISPLRNETLRVSASGSGEAEANSNAAMVDSATPLRTNAQPSIRQIQRKPIGGDDDPIHSDLIEEWRKRHGFPPRGKDAEGNQVGPTDAEIKYGGLLTQDQKSEKASPAPSQPKFDPASFVGSLGRFNVDKQGKILGWKMDELAKKVAEVLMASPNAYIRVNGYYPKGDTDFDPNVPIDNARGALVQWIGKSKIADIEKRIVTYYGSGGPYSKGIGGEIDVEVAHSSLGPNAISPGPSPKSTTDDKSKKTDEDKDEDDAGGLETKVKIIPVDVSIPLDGGKKEYKQKLTLEITYQIPPIKKFSGKRVDVSLGQFEVGFEGGAASGGTAGQSKTVPVAELGISVTVVEVKFKGGLTGIVPPGLKVGLGLGVTGNIAEEKIEPKGEFKIEGKNFFLNVEGGKESVEFSIGVQFDLADLFKKGKK
jgi:hypothetical protein